MSSNLHQSSLRVQLDHQVFVDVRQHVAARGRSLEHAAEFLFVHIEPVREADLSGHLERVLHAKLLAGLLADLHHVTGLHLVGGDGHRLAIDLDALVAHQLARLGARGRETHAVDDVVEPAFHQLQQRLAGRTGTARGCLVISAELALEHAVHAAQLLLLAQLHAVLGQALAALALDAAGRHLQLALAFEGLGAALQEQVGALATRELALGAGVSCHDLPQTRRFFGGRQPLSARTADSRPGPGPPTRTSTFFRPCSCAALPAFSAATWAAKGVLLREPRKPQPPDVAQDSVLPWRSVIVTIVLLKEAWM